MTNFLDGLRIALVILVGIVILIVGIIAYAIASTWETLVKIVKGKR